MLTTSKIATRRRLLLGVGSFGLVVGSLGAFGGTPTFAATDPGSDLAAARTAQQQPSDTLAGSICRSLGGTPVYVTRWWGKEFVRCATAAQ
jgi:hypothetical protein